MRPPPAGSAEQPLTVVPVRGIGEVVAGDDLATLVAGAVDLADGDVVVIAQKVVSKAEDRTQRARPGEAIADARLRLAHEQATQVLVEVPGVVVVRTRTGLVCANAGVDASNVPDGELLLLPLDPDASAARIRAGLAERSGVDVAVVVTDTFGRAWRDGQVDVAIGAAGLAAIRDERTRVDRSGRPLEVTRVAVLDEIAAAADLVRRKADGVPVVVVRGLDWDADPHGRAADLARPLDVDLFPRGRGALADVIAAPQALRGHDQRDLRRALDAATSVVAGTVSIDVHQTHHGVVVCPRARDGSTAAADLGVAAAVVHATLVDAGLAPRLHTGADPRVELALVRGDDHAAVDQPDPDA